MTADGAKRHREYYAPFLPAGEILPTSRPKPGGDILRRNRPLLNVYEAFKSDGHSIGAIFPRLSG
jgi:hypothetical protein